MIKCEFKTDNGCTAPIPVKCSDKCIIRELQAELKAQIKDNLECEKIHNDTLKQYKSLLEREKELLKAYDELKAEHNRLLAEISFTN